MTISPQDIISLRDEFIDAAMRSVRIHEKRPHRRQGALAGLKICRELDNAFDFETVLDYRKGEEWDLQARFYGNKGVTEEQYWEFRLATAQIEFILERMKIMWGLKAGETYSAQAMIDVTQRMQRRGLQPPTL